MNIRQVKEEALQIIDAYSENGYLLSDKQPERADYILRINGFVNQAILRIITVYPNACRLDFEDLERSEEFDGIHYRLPEDFFGMLYLGKGGDGCWGVGDYVILGRELITPYLSPPTCYYSVLPPPIPVNASEDCEIPVSEAGARLIPLYVAAMLTAEENASLSVRLLNQFEAMLGQRAGDGVVLGKM